MAVTQVVVCDCCDTTLDSSSVLDAAILTYQAENGEVKQAYFGIKCGCGGTVVAQVLEGDHSTHVPPPAPAPAPAPADAPPPADSSTPTPTPQPASEAPPAQ